MEFIVRIVLVKTETTSDDPTVLGTPRQHVCLMMKVDTKKTKIVRKWGLQESQLFGSATGWPLSLITNNTVVGPSRLRLLNYPQKFARL